MISRTSILPVFMGCLALPFSVSAAPPTYVAEFLGNDGGEYAVGFSVNTKNYVGGYGLLPSNAALHALQWRDSSAIDLGTLGGPDSGLFGTISGFSETAKSDPLGQDFCDFGTHLICLAFQLNGQTLIKLPTLGGYNAIGYSNNDKNQIVGIAQGPGHDPTCSSTPQPPLYTIQVNYPVIWQNGQITTTLPFLTGDFDAGATSINDANEVVGFSGDCTNVAPHGWIWTDGQVTNLGNLGGADYTYPSSINNYAQVTGTSETNEGYTHAFFWQQNGGMVDIGTLPGDTYSDGYWINNVGQIVGESCDNSDNCRAFLWQNNKMYNLNKLVTNNGALDLIAAYFITDGGDITGEAYNDANGVGGAFLAIVTGNTTAKTLAPAVEAGARVRITGEHALATSATSVEERILGSSTALAQ